MSARRAAELPGERALRTRHPGVQMERDSLTGAPKFIRARRGFLTGPNGEGLAVSPAAARAQAPGDRDRGVKAFLNEHRAVFGHGPEALASARKLREDTTGHSGLRTSVWQQELEGVPLFEARLQANETARGELVSIASGFVPDPSTAATKGMPRRAALLAAPPIGAAEAVRIAAGGIGAEVGSGNLTPIGPAAGVTRRQEFRTAALNGARAELIWLPMDGEKLRLCWDVLFTSKVRGELYRVLVDVETGEPQVRHCLTSYATPASYRVWTSDSPTPFSPGHSTPLTTQPPVVPQSLQTLTSLNATASPNGWINDGVTTTVGNNVAAHTDLDKNDIADLPRLDGGASRIFDFPADLTQAPTTAGNRRAAVVDLFYWCNVIHDRFYELGFTESAGNFQTDNFGRGGVGGDAVQADAQDGSGTDNANFSTPPDGGAGRMQMYLFSGPTPDRDGDFDHEIVIHEYAHGLSGRLVGGGVGISAVQTGGMGEGWSDFYALCLLAQPGDDVNGCYAAGAYATRQIAAGYEQNYYFGIRRYPYSTQLLKNPLTFKDIDDNQASAHSGVPRGPIGGATASEVHNVGEVWCAALWEVRANLIAAHGFAVGNELVLQLVTDGMKISPANPTFLQARDAIIQADQIKTGGANFDRLWAGFAKRGLGAYASSPGSNTTIGVVESFDPPDDLLITPTTPFATGGKAGGPFNPSSKSYTLKNTGTGSTPFTVTSNQPWLTMSPASGALAPEETLDVVVTVNAQANSLPVGTHAATLTFTNPASGISQTRSVSLIVTQPLHHFAIDPIPGQFVNHSFLLTVRAMDAGNQTLPYYTGNVTLEGSGSAAIPVTPLTLSEFVNGISRTPVQIGQVVNGMFLTVSDGAGHAGSSNSFPVTVGTPDFLTELFDSTTNDTAGATYTFTPVANRNFYVPTRAPASVFPTDPSGGTAMTFTDDSFVQVIPTNGAQLRLFGVSYSAFFVGSNGYVTFGAGDIEWEESIPSHFALPRVSALFDDLLPGSPGTITRRQLADRIAVTWQAVREYEPASSNNVQIELFFDGRVRITVLGIAAKDGLIGLSSGDGAPAGFVESDFSGYLSAPPVSSVLANQTILEDTSTAALALTISDDSTPAASLTLSASSSNPQLIPASGVQFGGTGGNRTVRVTPLGNQNGAATITLRVTDGQGRSTDVPFTVNVTPVNDAPAFVKGADQIVLEDAGPQVFAGWATGVSSGPADEAEQSLTFTVSSNAAELFAAGPTVDATGKLSFSPAPDANGTALVTVQLADNGGNANGGSSASAAHSFRIIINAVNDAPTLAPIADIILDEDAPMQTVNLTGITSGASNEQQTLTITASSSRQSVIPHPTVTYASPDSSGTLTFRSLANEYGAATVTVVVNDGETTISRIFNVTVNAINDPPTLNAIADVTVLEDAQGLRVPLTGIGPGPKNEFQQSVTITATSSEPSILQTQIASFDSGRRSAVLNGELAPNANGAATVTVTVNDGQASDGQTTRSFAVNVVPVNDAPSFQAGPNQAVRQNAGLQTIAGWATSILAGPADESGQALEFIVTADHPELFTVLPTVSPEGTLTFSPAPDANGTASVTVTLKDGGGVANGGVDSSAAETFLISSTPVNDPPSFVLGSSQSVTQDAGAQIVRGFASAILPGPPDETAQSVQFIVQTLATERALFSVPPAISPDGTLTFTPAPDASGTATLSVRLQDNGGTEDGGSDTSAAQDFQIAITTQREEAGTYNGLALPVSDVLLDAEKTGLIKITIGVGGRFSGRLKLGSFSFGIRGRFDKSGLAHFGRDETTSLVLVRRGLPSLELSLQLDVQDNTDRLSGLLRE
ncbi:MAG TPA: M36 family metallopeptidase, partial [Chthoniobacteraceae bacterium]